MPPRPSKAEGQREGDKHQQFGTTLLEMQPQQREKFPLPQFWLQDQLGMEGNRREKEEREEKKKKSRDFPHSLWALGVSFSVPQTRTKMFSTLISLNHTAHFQVLVCIMVRPVDTVRKKWQTPYSSSSNSSVLLFYACWYLISVFSNATHAVWGGMIASFSERERLACAYSIFTGIGRPSFPYLTHFRTILGHH